MNEILSGFERYDVYHMGIVVQDVPQAVNTWAKVYGAGPFYHFSTNYDLEFRGEQVKFTETSAFGKFGRFVVELQNFTFDTPVPELQEILGTQLNTINHAGFLTEDPAAASARLEATGIPLFLQGSVGDNVFYWHDARKELGHFVEVFLNRDIIRKFHAAVASVAEGWDGTEPLRTSLPAELEVELGPLMHKN